MSAQVVFLSLFLGLISGVQPIDFHVDGPVKSIRVSIGGREVATVNQPPWRAVVDLGAELTPREIVARAYDERGEEIARASQLINLPRPEAEFEIVLRSEGNRTPAAIELRWRHLTNARPKRATITVDGKPLTVDAQFHARVPPLDPLIPHVIAAEMRFEDGFIARRELVIEGLRSDSIGTQLSPVLVTGGAGQPPATAEGCFSVDGVTVRTSAIEKPSALVIVVQDPDARQTAAVLLRTASVTDRLQNTMWSHAAHLDRQTSQRILWPITQRFVAADRATAVLFESGVDVDASERGMLWLLTRNFGDRSRLTQPRQFADAVAVAGLNALKGGRRRAVVLVLGNQQDSSRYDPQTVRRYLAAVGVPLFVWSVTTPASDLAASWGDVEDVSTTNKLHDAADRLARTLETQRVAWIAADPLAALRVSVAPECGLAPVARLIP